METYQQSLQFQPRGPGLLEITGEVAEVVRAAGIGQGLCHVFLQHTSASLLIQENADPSARADLEAFFERLAPTGAAWYTHTAEGPDDMPAHLRAALTQVSEQVPVVEGRLGLGTWQGLYLFEHRRRPGTRRVVVTVQGT